MIHECVKINAKTNFSGTASVFTYNVPYCIAIYWLFSQVTRKRHFACLQNVIYFCNQIMCNKGGFHNYLFCFYRKRLKICNNCKCFNNHIICNFTLKRCSLMPCNSLFLIQDSVSASQHWLNGKNVHLSTFLQNSKNIPVQIINFSFQMK